MRRQQDLCIGSAVLASQLGDAAVRNDLLEYLSPHILRAGGSFLGRHITVSDDEYSVGLIALDEAINSFDPDKGASFLTFFETVLKRRLIDYLRKTSRVKEVPRSGLVSALDTDDSLDTDAEIAEAQKQFQDYTLISERAEEIATFSLELSHFGLSFTDLPDQSPKHVDAKRTAFRLAASLVRDGQLWETFLQKGMLPVTVLAHREGVNRKTVERNRKYIIAIALIIGGDYPLLSQYLGGF